MNRLDQKAYEYLRQNHTPSQELIGRLSAQYYTEDDFLQVDWTPLFRTLADAGVNTPQNKGEL